MMNFRKAREAFHEARMQYISKAKEPGLWDVALGLDAMAADLEKRLDHIEANQKEILRLLRQAR